MKRKVYTLEEARKKLEYYCAYQDRSHWEVSKKLKEMQMIPEAIDQILLHLIQENFLNEERFVRSFVRGKFYQKKWGKNKIKQGLYKHKIHLNLITKAFSEIKNEDYNQTIEDLIEKKKNDYKVSRPYQLKQKISKYLLQKGYAYDEFAEILENKL